MKLYKLVASLLLALSPIVAMGQSSGNFAATIDTGACVVNNQTGDLTGGISHTLLRTTIKTPNSSQTALVIRPSLVTGLFTRTKATATDPTASATAGVRVRVLLDGKIVAPGSKWGQAPTQDGNTVNDGWVYYDKRFQLLSSNLFTAIVDPACDNPSTPEVEGCFIELVLSTLNAGSLDFVAPNVGGGDHTVVAEWQLDPSGANQAACVGPGVVTVTQVKTFNQSGGIVIQ